jgi:CheY-like chemotaxis protein
MPASPRRVLVVEDNALARRMLRRSLAARGHHLTFAATVAEALSLEGRFEVGVIDGELPDGDGVALARDLLARGVVDRVVFFTASADEDLLAAAAVIGTVIHKDFTALLSLIEQ